jgi:transcriptional regulator with XRE-family HTH domain
MKLADRLRAFRRTHRLTQEAASERLGVPLRTWQNWEISRNTPRGFALHALEQELARTPPETPPPARRNQKKPRTKRRPPPPRPGDASPAEDQITLATHLL